MIPDSRSVVRKAYANVGYSCKGKYNSYAKWIDKNYPNFYNGKKYGVADWCDIFVDFCVLSVAKSDKDAEKVLCQPAKSAGAGVKWSYQYYKSKKRNTSIPHYGDQIFLSNSKTKFAHTGIVYKVTAKCVYYIAGNEAGKKKGRRYVKKHKILRSNKKIYAYGRPFYSDWQTIK